MMILIKLAKVPQTWLSEKEDGPTIIPTLAKKITSELAEVTPSYLSPDLLPKFYHRAKPHQAKPSLEGLEPVRDFLVILAG